jgi:hypothetical protein
MAAEKAEAEAGAEVEVVVVLLVQFCHRHANFPSIELAGGGAE